MEPNEDDDYIFTRSYRDSARLVLQHWLWVHRLKYVLHPSIPAETEHLRIADVGTGNAVWITEVLSHLPPSTQIDGFDISAEHWPAREWLPSNISLHLFDVFGQVPEHLLGRYDIVHLRAFTIVVRNNDPTGVLRNLIKMLKPGGYLQWDEVDLGTFSASTVDPSASKAAATEIVAKWKSECAKSGIVFDWIPTLESLFRENGLVNVNATTFPPIHEQRKAYTDNILMGLEDSCDLFSARDKASELGAKPQWRELFQKAVMETKEGVSFTADMVVVLGQKPV